jgi:hypothetical protein
MARAEELVLVRAERRDRRGVIERRVVMMFVLVLVLVAVLMRSGQGRLLPWSVIVRAD